MSIPSSAKNIFAAPPTIWLTSSATIDTIALLFSAWIFTLSPYSFAKELLTLSPCFRWPLSHWCHSSTQYRAHNRKLQGSTVFSKSSRSAKGPGAARLYEGYAALDGNCLHSLDTARSGAHACAGCCGWREFRTYTGMFFSIAGIRVDGCNTFAPRCASSEASSKLMLLMCLA